MSNQEYIDHLNKIRASEMRMSLVYRMAAQMLIGPWREGLAKEFRKHSEDEIHHASIVMGRIIALGGQISSDIEPLPMWHSLEQILNGIEDLEKQGVDNWQKLYNFLSSDDAFKHIVTNIISKEQNHLDEAKRWARSGAQEQVKEDVEKLDDLDNVSDDAESTGSTIDQDSDVPDEEVPDEDPAVEEYSVVGDDRRLVVYALDPDFRNDMEVGQAWQDVSGQLYGTGLCDMMMFEPFAAGMETNSSIGLDVSPLSVLAFRLSMSPFVRVEWKSEDE